MSAVLRSGTDGPSRAGGADTVRLAAAAAVCALAGLAFAPMFTGWRADAVIVGAVLVPGVLGAVVSTVLPPARSAVRDRIRMAASLGALAAFVWLTTNPGLAVVNGPAELLMCAIPLESRGPGLAAVAAAMGLAAFVTAELVLRSRSILAPVVPPLVCFAAALAVGASAPPMPMWLPGALVAATGALLVVSHTRVRLGRAARKRRGPRLVGAAPAEAAPILPRAVSAACAVLAAVGVAVPLGPHAPGASLRPDRFDLRAVLQPVTPPTAVNPLTLFPSLLASKDDEPVFTFRASRTGLLFRAVTLSRFDGRSWTTDATYRRAGQTMPEDPSAAVPDDRVSASVELPSAARRILPWIPTPGHAVRITPPGLGVDEATGDLVVLGRTPPPKAYDVVAAPPPDPAAARGAVAERFRSGESGYSVPGKVRAAAVRAASGGRNPGGQTPGSRSPGGQSPGGQIPDGQTAYDRLSRLRDYFRTGFACREDAPSGNGLYQIAGLLSRRRGTPEQFASAFAVMARELGYDARVVFGFRPSRATAGSERPVRARDAYVWAEVRFRRLGWVPFDPSPEGMTRGEARARPRADADADAGAGPGNRAPQPPPPEARDARGAPRHHAGPHDAAGTTWWAVLGWIGGCGLAAVLIGAFAVPLAKRARRRRRRRTADPGASVTGAWRDTVERLVEHGLPAPPAMTAVEVAGAARDRLGPAGARELARLAHLADAARYSREGVTAAEAADAWRTADDLRVTWRPGARSTRLRHLVDPRPLARR